MYLFIWIPIRNYQKIMINSVNHGSSVMKFLINTWFSRGLQRWSKCQIDYTSASTHYIRNMTWKTFLEEFTGLPFPLPSKLYLLFQLKMVHFLFKPPSFFFVFSLCMQILSDLSELCVSVREPLWFGVTEDCTHGDCIHWAYSEPCISNWDVSMCSHIPTTKL